MTCARRNFSNRQTTRSTGRRKTEGTASPLLRRTRPEPSSLASRGIRPRDLPFCAAEHRRVCQSPLLKNELQRRPQDAEAVLRAEVEVMEGASAKHFSRQRSTRPEPASRSRKRNRPTSRLAAAFSGPHGWTINLSFTTILLVHFLTAPILLFKLFTNCIAACRYFGSGSMARNWLANRKAFS